MLAVAGRPPDHAGWAVEMKWDGARVIAITEPGSCRLYSRNKQPVTGSYPEVVTALVAATAGRELILDGELIVQDATGAPSFGLLQRRMHVVRPSTSLVASTPVQLYAFDVLAIDGQSAIATPYLQRRDLLGGLGLESSLVRVPPHWVGVDADRLLAVASEHHLEGIVSKRIDSTYQPGRRSHSWIKTAIRKTTSAVVAGWLPGSGSSTRTFGSLVLGAHDPHSGQLVHIGNVGTGFSGAARRDLQGRLDELATVASPFSNQAGRGLAMTHWVRPVLVGAIEYREYTGEGLRHPSWRGIRTDKNPDETRLPD
ncbi:non-homologous end-joining DNA ligase [Nocardia noduli]|uniref:non-homologous end-joining DNA ligase n=1 Tax=Nocardia noduli TaxID=2815722 RepID=UPI001C2323BD|nr:non-homologous end-joining DNA ligase [Nocardia noduli]